MADLLGFPVLDEGPTFMAALTVHVLAGLTCVVCGATAALVRKGVRCMSASAGYTDGGWSR
jgi:hypothetical protein